MAHHQPRPGLPAPLGLVFFAFVLDADSRMIVGWQLATHMRTDLVLDALKMALHRRDPVPVEAGPAHTTFQPNSPPIPERLFTAP